MILEFLDSYWPLILVAAAAICIYIYWKKLTTKIGITLMIAGVAAQFLNIITYGLWEIDIDIFGVMMFVIGLIIFIVVKVRERKGRIKQRKKL